MEQPASHAADELMLTPSRLVDLVAICDRFEAAWRLDRRTRLEDYLPLPSNPLRKQVLENLLAVQFELLSTMGEPLVLEEFLERFPDDASVVRSVFERTQVDRDISQPASHLTEKIDTAGSSPADQAADVLTELEEGMRRSRWEGQLGETERIEELPDAPAGPSDPDATREIHHPSEASDSTAELANLPPQLGRFVPIRALGRGTFAEVFLAWDSVLQREVAIKIPRLTAVSPETGFAESLTEARKAARLRHPGIVTIHDVIQHEEGWAFVVMEFIPPGKTLRERMEAGRLPPEQTAALIAEVADAIHYAHTQGIVHRDLKPGNILIDAADRPLVADFGLAVHQSSQSLQFGEIAGTAPYMAPEQVRGESHRLDGRTDVWALGVMLYELLAHRRPFGSGDRELTYQEILYCEPRPPRQLDESIPWELERICLKCLSKRMSDRYATAVELAGDLRHWITTTLGSDESGLQRRTDSGKVRVVPRGLRSFGREDATFFLELMPGPRGRDGLPESVRFWKSRIETIGQAIPAPFPIGLLYGPSGCGKSSLVHAGLLPALGSQVVSVSVAASARANETEAELLRRLLEVCPKLSGETELTAALRRLRQGEGLPAGVKLLMVLDQFEQWLQHGLASATPPLVEALRQCDGTRLQCLILVRDDFWMALTQFLQTLEISLASDWNMAAVDLFEPRHARGVLAAFGVGYGTLPEDPKALGENHIRFLDQAIEGLLENGRIIPVRLTLFAEMVKDRPWDPYTLKQLGGIEGVGVAFLEATIGGGARHPIIRMHRGAARGVMEALLPPPGSSLKGQLRSYDELLAASSAPIRLADFDELLRILDRDLRLITPAERHDPADLQLGVEGNLPGALPEPPRPTDAPATAHREVYYQLTHDYLVQPIRDWLDLKRRETRAGRAQRRLETLAAMWNNRPQARFLPSMLEWLSIRWHTRRRDWSESEQRMMTTAERRLLIQLAGLGVCLILAALGWNRWYHALRRENLMERLQTVRTQDIPELVGEIRPLLPSLRDRLASFSGQKHDESPAQLVASLALLTEDPASVETLTRRLLRSDPAELELICAELPLRRQEAAARCWNLMRDPATNRLPRLRLACALAALEPASRHWNEELEIPSPGAPANTVADFVAAAVVKENNPETWVRLLRPAREVLAEPLRDLYRSPRTNLTERVIAGILLTGLFEDDGIQLAELILEASAEQFRFVLPSLLRLSDRSFAVERLLSELRQRPEGIWGDLPFAPPDHVAPPVRKWLESASGTLDDHCAFCLTLPLEKLEETVAALEPFGYRPLSLRPYLAGSRLLVAASWRRDFRRFRIALDRTAEALRAEDAEFRRQWETDRRGFLPVDVACYRPSREPFPERYAAVWVEARGHDEKPGRFPLGFLDSRMYVGVDEHRHSEAYEPLNRANYRPRTNVKVVAPDGTSRVSSVRWKLLDPPRFADTWDLASWEAVLSEVDLPSDEALTNLDVQFSRVSSGGEIGWATTWWAGLEFETRTLHDLDPQTHLRQGLALRAEGFRPLSIAAAATSGGAPDLQAKSQEQSAAISIPPIKAASVWQRPLPSEDQKDHLAQRQANGLIALYTLGHRDPFWSALAHHPDPRLRSELIERIARFDIDLRPLVEALAPSSTHAVSVRRALLMALGGVPRDRLDAQRLLPELTNQVAELYQLDPDAGVHSAAEYALRRWGQHDLLRVEARGSVTPDASTPARSHWWVTPHGHTMIVLPGPLRFTMGSPGNEPHRNHHEERPQRRIVWRSIAASSKEVTVAQFLRFRPNHPQATQYGTDPDSPVNMVTWFDAAAYCNELSRAEGLTPCYPEPIGPDMMLLPGVPVGSGYRLPTEEEWEYLCRAGATTSRYYGHSRALIDRYAVTQEHAEETTSPVGRRQPNDFGFFDTLGNLFEWCHDRHLSGEPGIARSPVVPRVALGSVMVPQTASGFGLDPWFLINREKVERGQQRVMRGGSFLYMSTQARCAYRDKNPANRPEPYLGFRVVRTLEWLTPPSRSAQASDPPTAADD